MHHLRKTKLRHLAKMTIATWRLFMSGDNWSSRRLWREFPGKNWARTSVDRLLKKIYSTGVTECLKGSGHPRSVCTLEFRKTSNVWLSSWAVMKVLCTSTKVHMKLKGRRSFHGRLFGLLQSMILQLKIYNACQRLLSFTRWHHYIFQSCLK